MPKDSRLPTFIFHPEEKARFVGFSIRTGKASYYIRYRDPVSRKTRERVGGTTHTEVIQTLEKFVSAVTVGGLIASPQTLFYEVVEDWFAREVTVSKKPSTEKNYRYYTERFLLPTFGEQRFSRITKPILDDFFSRLDEFDAADPERLTEQTVSFDNVQQAKKVTKSLFRWANENQYADGNAAAHLRLETNPNAAETITYSPEQFHTLMGYVNPYYRTHLTTLFYSSMRWGEMAALPWRNVTFRDDGRVDIYIGQALSDGIVDTPKTKKSKRTITLPAFVADDLKAHQILQQMTQEPHPDDLVFTSSVGLQLNPTRFRERSYYAALTRANKDLKAKELPELPKVQIKGLRHSTISVLAMQPTLANVVVQQHAGHTNPKTTSIYTHIDEQRRVLVADALENAHAAAVGHLEIVDEQPVASA